MVFQPTIIVNQTGSSGIPAYDSLEEITSPTEGMVVKINGQEGGSGTPRGVEVGDVLNVVTWADSSSVLTVSNGFTLLTFSDGSKIEAYIEYSGDWSGYYAQILFGNTDLTSWDGNPEDFKDPPEFQPFISTSFDFGGRTVSEINDASIQSVIIVTPIPDKYYIYKDSAWVELVDLADVITTSTTDLEDGVSSLATGTYYFVIEE